MALTFTVVFVCSPTLKYANALLSLVKGTMKFQHFHDFCHLLTDIKDLCTSVAIPPYISCNNDTIKNALFLVGGCLAAYIHVCDVFI